MSSPYSPSFSPGHGDGFGTHPGQLPGLGWFLPSRGCKRLHDSVAIVRRGAAVIVLPSLSCMRRQLSSPLLLSPSPPLSPTSPPTLSSSSYVCTCRSHAAATCGSGDSFYLFFRLLPQIITGSNNNRAVGEETDNFKKKIKPGGPEPPSLPGYVGRLVDTTMR